MSWTEESVEHLRKLWADGLSASKVAAELGAGFTRNAVIGKIHRLGIAERETALVKPARNADAFHARQKAQKEAQGRILPVKPNGQPAPASAPTTVPLEDEIAIPITGRVSLIDLTVHTCRWPFGDPLREGFAFCGAPGADVTANPVRPYCEAHARIAYQPAQSFKPHRRKSADRHTAWLARTQ